ncbi:MAG: DegT/DnrJ/EryC1/StrS family aminotransferase [Victivallales bacterium]|nr:DegT/DnrJ/EryC1/StrS family aminotransferase [Victivallales bacterium]
MTEKLAVHGGSKTIKQHPEELFHWPIVTDEDIDAVTSVLKAGTMSGTVITKEFEKEYAAWNGTEYALGTCNGTSGLAAAIWACGVGAGDEVIAPSLTYWATCAAALTFGATVNFADVDPESLCIDAKDIEHRISSRTKAIIVVNYGAMPADFDGIMSIARKHGIKVIEDNSHAQGSIYKGRMCGSIGDIAVASLMTGKAFAIGEAGIITTSNRELFERCVAFGHYERTGAPSRFNPVDAQVHLSDLIPFQGMPIGAVKHRMNQTCAAMGRVQLKHYPERTAVINDAMNYFADKLDLIPGLKVIRPEKKTNSSKGAWYFPLCHYDSSEFHGLQVDKFAEAICAEGILCGAPNLPLHLHNFFHLADIFHMNNPTAVSFGQRDVRQGPGTLPVTEAAKSNTITLPWFKYFDREAIDLHISGYQKVADQVKTLL